MSAVVAVGNMSMKGLACLRDLGVQSGLQKTHTQTHTHTSPFASRSGASKSEEL